MDKKLYAFFICAVMFNIGRCTERKFFREDNKEVVQKVERKLLLNTPSFLTSELNNQHLIEALEFYELQYPHIVHAQAILETGHFKSRICKNYNNLFGLYDSKNKDYYKFNHWSESVVAYKEYVQKKYKPSKCYYTFLKDLPYATDSTYISKIKGIVKRYENIAIK